MALFVPARNSLKRERNFSGRPATNSGTTLTASATPHALPASPTQIIAATAFEADCIRITMHGMSQSATNTDGLINLYIGGAGSETLFIDSLPAGWTGVHTEGMPTLMWFPVRIPRGTRLSASLRALIASDTCQIHVELMECGGSHWVGSGVETLGEDTAASEGTDVTPGSASEGTWTSIATSGRRYRYIHVGVFGGNDTTAAAQANAWDIGTGSAVLQGLEDFMHTDDIAEHEASWGDDGFWCDIPSSTALQLRAQSHASPSGLKTALLYGVY